MCISTIFAQSNDEQYHLSIQRATDDIQLDGRLDEQSWKDADTADDFWQRSPIDDQRAHLRTVGRLTYDDQNLYVGITVYDPEGNYIIQTLQRDESLWNNDGVTVIIDPIGERTNGYMFACNSTGAQTDVQVGGGSGDGNYGVEWNNKWFSETHLGDGYWSVEMAIPFKSLRYDADKTRWLINFARSDAKHNQTHAWARIPRQFWLIDLGYAGSLHWDAPPPRAKSNIALIPYVSAGHNKDFSAEEPTDNNFSIGGDAKIAITPSLNLDLTVNPDFSQVEVDQQVTNLTRFSIFFPERRNFFLENSNLFADFGSPLLRPFFSRRIGLGSDGTPVPIQVGARLSGNLNDNLRIGLLDVQTGSKGDIYAQNYFTAAASQRVLDRSSISAYFTNRQAFDGTSAIDGDYGRNAGVELDYQSKDGVLSSWFSYNLSYKPGISGDNVHARAGIDYNGKVINSTLAWGLTNTDYYADVGFVNRIIQYNSETGEAIRQGYSYFFFPTSVTIIPKEQHTVQSIEFGVDNFINFDPDMKRTDASHGFNFNMEFTNSSQVGLELDLNKVRLQYPFAFLDATPLPAGEYSYRTISVGYESDERKLFNYAINLSTGGFYNGERQQVGLELNYRTQPWGQFSLSGEYNNLSFPDEYGTEKIYLLGSRAEISFSRDLFWSTFLQYNTQADNFNINSRLQWQFEPLSWLFLVYTDNYLTPGFGPKTRSLVFKLNYWLNL